MEKKAYSHIVWDWNGTLLDDVAWCIHCVNRMLAKRGKALVPDTAAYHEAFCFPVVEYYKNVGFDLAAEPFAGLAEECMALYHGPGGEQGIRLHTGARHAVKTVRERGLSQIILSASAQDNLLSQIRPFKLQPYFNEVLGISDIYAKGKVERGLAYLAENRVRAGLLVGDTTHDYEVAAAMGLDCLLVAGGHQSKARLLECPVPVCDTLQEAMEYIL